MENKYFDIKKLSFGDIILAHRKEEILEKGHEISPHIVIGIEEDYVVVLQGSSKEYKEEYERHYYKVEEGKHTFNKDTYFAMNKFRRIHKNNVIRYIDSLVPSENLYLQKKIAFINRSSYHSTDWVVIDTPELEVGDIITEYSFSDKENYYFILEITDEYYKCIHLRRNIEEGCTNINGNYYVFDYDRITTIKDKDNYVRFDALKSDQLRSILTEYKNHVLGIKNKELKRGSLVSKDGSLYYIYNIEKDICSTYRVSLDNDYKSPEIKINNTSYYTNFKEDTFKTNCKLLTILDQATEEEIEENKRIKKFSLKRKKKTEEKQKNIKSTNISTGALITLKNNDQKRLVVIYRIGNEIYAIDYDDYLNNRKRIEVGNVSQYTKVCKLPSNEFCNILEFFKESMQQGKYGRVFKKVYNSYINTE